jgi:hypothetical protein
MSEGKKICAAKAATAHESYEPLFEIDGVSVSGNSVFCDVESCKFSISYDGEAGFRKFGGCILNTVQFSEANSGQEHAMDVYENPFDGEMLGHVGTQVLGKKHRGFRP